jgi:hypothetical protein
VVGASAQEAAPIDAGHMGSAVESFEPPLDSKPFPVDLAELKKKMPDNVYWENDAPTDDEAILRRRHARAIELNRQLGKVLANEATVVEINAYYDQLERVSNDHLAFAEAVLNAGGEDLSERDRGLLEYGVVLHTQKLKELKVERADALRRQRERKK